MDPRFVSKKILITGAGSGMGRASAIRLAAEGGAIWCTDVNESGLQETVQIIEAAGGTAHYQVLDVTDAAAVEQSVAKMVEELGGLDVLCNIAGIGGMTKFEDLTSDKFQTMLAVNLTGPFHCSHAALPHLLESKGNIVNMASTAGLIGQAYVAAYVASKHGLVGLTKSMAMEFGQRGLRCNAICPGSINTPMISDFAFPDGVDPKLIQRYTFQDWFAEADDVAGMVAYVASDEARYVNGAVMAIDGGITTG